MAQDTADRAALLETFVSRIAGYRRGEISPLDEDHVETWLNQFPEEVREPLLRELDHVLKRTYSRLADVRAFLVELSVNKKLTNQDPANYWRGVNFLEIQAAGASQREMLAIFDEVLEERLGFGVSDCRDNAAAHAVYIDDGIFTGNRVARDLTEWIQRDAPAAVKLEVVTIAQHSLGVWHATGKIKQAAVEAGKRVEVRWWRVMELEDRRTYINQSDVLRPSLLPDDDLVAQYVNSLRYEPVLRRPGSIGRNGFFSSEEARHLLEQELLKVGARIRSICPNLNKYQRPLGNMVLDTLGFGTLFLTFRNCPNNCPLAFWAGDPWYPLFPRKTN